MTNITTTAPLVRPIGRILLLLAILFLLPGIWITWPEGGAGVATAARAEDDCLRSARSFGAAGGRNAEVV